MKVNACIIQCVGFNLRTSIRIRYIFDKRLEAFLQGREGAAARKKFGGTLAGGFLGEYFVGNT
ncbi:MAG: hypothetical protein D3924_06215 [Candidatus Electrothrix sp. AR4]|nr:hypothetical protein [Candidatus Electrothrix sp. AR4]